MTKRDQIIVPFEETIGIGGDGIDIYRSGDLFVRRMVSGQVLGATPFIAPPTWSRASDWLFAGAICRTATAWYSLETPESLLARGISDSTKWVSLSLVNDASSSVSILNATNIDVDIIDARVFNVDVTYATTTNTTVLYASAVITLPYEQIFQGDGYTADIVMDHPAHTEGFIVEAITTEHISHVWEWELNSAYTQNLDADGYVTSISLVSGYRWYHNNRFRIRYVRADL